MNAEDFSRTADINSDDGVYGGFENTAELRGLRFG
jgi:hypothetical protein